MRTASEKKATLGTRGSLAAHFRKKKHKTRVTWERWDREKASAGTQGKKRQVLIKKSSGRKNYWSPETFTVEPESRGHSPFYY